jgi:hypothetical protein
MIAIAWLGGNYDIALLVLRNLIIAVRAEISARD